MLGGAGEARLPSEGRVGWLLDGDGEGELNATMHAEFAEDLSYVPFRGERADAEIVCDFRVRVPARDESSHFALARRELSSRHHAD
jgi:hypothetical protein